MRMWKKLSSAFDWLLLALGFAGAKPFLTLGSGIGPRQSSQRKTYAPPVGGGQREIARRRRQIERGVLKCSAT